MKIFEICLLYSLFEISLMLPSKIFKITFLQGDQLLSGTFFIVEPIGLKFGMRMYN